MFKLLTFVTLSLWATQSLVHANAGPSSVPSAQYTCPPIDNADFQLEDADLNSNPIFCSYPVFPGENPNDFFCTYSATTGHLVEDGDAGFCPPSAVATNLRRRRSDKVARNPLPSRPPILRGIPAGVSEKGYLKKHRVRNSESA